MGKLIFLWVCFCLLSTSCIASRRFAQAPNAALSANPSRVDYPISCEDEDKNASPTLNYPANIYSFFIEPNCAPRNNGPQKSVITQYAQIIFVIDMTDTMTESLQTIRLSLQQFSQGLLASGWDVRYAAIGFADDFNTFLITSIDTADSLLSQMTSWSTTPGGDRSEAGQLALAHALKMLEDYQNQNPARADANAIIFYVSDAMMYAGNNQKDFSTDELSQKFKNALHRFTNFRLYYSIPQDASATLSQIEGFLAQSGIQGSAVGSPISAADLKVFSSEFTTKTASPFGQCQLRKVRFAVTASGSLLPLQKPVPNVFEYAKQREPFHFKVSDNPKETKYTLFIDRCCTDSELSVPTCDHPEAKQLNLSFPSSSGN